MTTCGEEGLAMLATLQPQGVFLDINMPRLNGGQILKKIREDKIYNAVKVCILSTGITNVESAFYKKM
jgi:CheY-like chemotaxis protein